MGLKYDFDEDADYVTVEKIKSRRERKSETVPSFCRANGKIMYRTRKAANERMKQIIVERELSGNLDRVERNIYQCVHCKSFHLTSQKNRVTSSKKNMKKTIDSIFNNDRNDLYYSSERASKTRQIAHTI